VFYVHPDHLGTPRVITASTALVATTGTGITSAQIVNKAVWRWDSDPFGSNATANSAPNENPNTLSQVVGTATLPCLFGFDLAFPGQKRDRESGKHYNYFRDYDPQVGRYIKSDPIGLKGGLSTYGYVGADPANSVDPSGLIKWSGALAGMSVAAGVGGGVYRFSFQSECRCGKRARAEGFASGVGLGAGFRFGKFKPPEMSFSIEAQDFYDGNECPEPHVFDGLFALLQGSALAGTGGSCGVVKLGGAWSTATVSKVGRIREASSANEGTHAKPQKPKPPPHATGA
jgi:RHS repeat-associated protein